MIRWPFIAISAAAGVALVVACGSFSEGSEGGGDASSPDVSTETGPVTDDGGSVDAAPGPVERCLGTVRVADGFGTVPPGGWVITPGSLFAASDAGRPPPSLFTETPALAPDGKADNLLTRELPLSGHKQVCIELDLLLDVGDGAFTGKSFAEILDISPNEGTSYYVELRPEAFSFVQGTSPTVIAPFEYGAWQHLVVRFAFGSPASPSLAVDDAPPVLVPASATEVPSSVTVGLGIQARGGDGGTTAVRVNIDNFRFTTEP